MSTYQSEEPIIINASASTLGDQEFADIMSSVRQYHHVLEVMGGVIRCEKDANLTEADIRAAEDAIRQAVENTHVKARERLLAAFGDAAGTPVRAVSERAPDDGKGILLEDAIERLRRIQSLRGCERPMRLVVHKQNPGGLTAHQTTPVENLYAGIDWEAGQVILKPARPLTEITPEQLDDIMKSVRKGSSWHAYQREKKLQERIDALEAELKSMKIIAYPKAGAST